MSDFVQVKQEFVEDYLDMSHISPPQMHTAEPTRQLSQVGNKELSSSVDLPWLEINSAYIAPTKVAPLFVPTTTPRHSHQDHLSDDSHQLSEEFAHAQPDFSLYYNLLPTHPLQRIPLPSVENDVAEVNSNMANGRNAARMTVPTPRAASLASRRESQFSPVDQTSSATAMDTTSTPSRGSVDSNESSGKLKRQERGIYDLDALPLAEVSTV